MANAKTNVQRISFFLILSYFTLFPFGQLLRINALFNFIPITIHPLDIIVGFSIPVVLLSDFKAHRLRRYFVYFWSISLLSLLFALVVYPIEEVLRGSLYLLRFISYYFFFELMWNTIRTKTSRLQIIRILLGTLLITAVLGWLQYFFAPDLRYLKIFHWDDHYYRLAGTILDPGFTGILMVIGVIVSTSMYIQTKQKVYIVLSTLFAATCLFTYARASFIALGLGLFVLFYLQKKVSLTLISFITIVGFMFLLPKGEGEGVNLLRTNSIFQKFENYQETTSIILDAPLIGVGFNTLCSERLRRFEEESFQSHACSGSDSSLLFVLATTGVIGFFTFISLIFAILKSKMSSAYKKMFLASAAAVLVHSFFLNSLFYPWVMGILFVLLAVSVNSIKENKIQ